MGVVVHGLEKFCDIDTEDRYQVADFVGKTVSEMYFEGISMQPNLDKIVAEVEKTGKLLDKKSIEDLER